MLLGRRPDPSALRPAVFLDRDGTIIEQVHYLSDPADVRLLPGGRRRPATAAGGRLRLRRRDQPIGDRRGGWSRSRCWGGSTTEMDRQLAAERAALDGIEYCPEAPAGDDRTAVEHFDRKPGPGMLVRAAG